MGIATKNAASMRSAYQRIRWKDIRNLDLSREDYNMGSKTITTEVSRDITVCDLCNQKCTGTWLYIWRGALPFEDGRQRTKGLRQWFVEIVRSMTSGTSYDICHTCIKGLVDKELARKGVLRGE